METTHLTVAVFVVLMVYGLSGLAEPAEPSGKSNFKVELGPPAAPEKLLLDSPFGINTALSPNAGDLDQRMDTFQHAGIKWGRQDFTWRRIETAPGEYDWKGYDKLVDEFTKHGVMIFGNFAYGPSFHDPRTPEGVKAYADFAAAAVKRYKGRVDYWQIWNEPNGGFWNGTPEQYAALLAAAGKAIHEANPDAKVLGLNMAFCDVRWADKILSLVPYDCFDIACFHPYRVMGAPEDKFDWWMLDQYVKSWNAKTLDENYPLIRMTLLEQTDELIKVMKKHGEPKPLWVTEICWNTNIHPYGTPEIRQADMIVRFYVQAVASGKIKKAFWWTLKDGRNDRQFDMGDMVGLVRPNYEPKYAYYAFGIMTRMLEGKKHLGNFQFGPDVFTCCFHDEQAGKDIIVAWANKPYAYVKVNNTEKGLTFYDIYGTRRFVPYDQQRTSNLTVPLGESPIYIVGEKGTRTQLRPDPGW